MIDKEMLQAISNIMDEKMDKLESGLRLEIKKLNERMGRLEERMGQLEESMGRLEERMDQLVERVGQLEERVGQLEGKVGRLEGRVGQLEGKVGRLEERMNQFEDKVCQLEDNLKSEIRNVWIVLENRIEPNINKLAENFPNLRQIRENGERITKLESEVGMLNGVVSGHSGEIQEIQKKIS